MLLAILSDLHLTNSLPYTVSGDLSRKDKLKKYLAHFFSYVHKNQIDYLVLPGDICHSAFLNSDDLDLLLYLINHIIRSGIPTIFISGNHDLDGNTSILSFLSGQVLNSNIHYNSKIFKSFQFDNITFDTINYCSHEKFLKNAFLAAGQKKKTMFSILVGHVGVKGTLHGSTKSIIGVKKEDIERLSEHYDLIILGHHHKFQWITDNCFYAGSIHQTRMDEVDTIPGGLIITLPTLKAHRIENTFSPRFTLIDNYKIDPEEISGSIVKPIVDTEKVSEEDNLKFLKDVLKCNPYYLVQPRLKRTFLIEEKKANYSSVNKRKALLSTMRDFKLEEKRRKKFYEHTLDIYEKVKGGK